MNRILSHLRANLIAYLALFVALGGTSYAAFTLPANSVGTRQLQNHSVTPIKFDRRSVGAFVRAWAVIRNGNQVVASRPAAKVVSWDPSFAAGDVSWGRSLSKACFALASGGSDIVQVSLLPTRHNFNAHFQAFTNAGQFDSSAPLTVVTVLCPEP